MFVNGRLVIGALSLALCAAGQFFILRPTGLRCVGAGPRRAWLLPLSRGVFNGAAVMLALTSVSYPLPAAIAEGIVAGLQSGLWQRSSVNAHYGRLLRGAPTEGQRFLRWAGLEGLYYGGMKSAGLVFGGGPDHAAALIVMYGRMFVFAMAQYPWVAAIAFSRQHQVVAAGSTPEKIRSVADAQTLAVSVLCVGLCALNSVGVSSSRFGLLALGTLGLARYLRLRRRWSRPGSWRRAGTPEEDVSMPRVAFNGERS